MSRGLGKSGEGSTETSADQNSGDANGRDGLSSTSAPPVLIRATSFWDPSHEEAPASDGVESVCASGGFSIAALIGDHIVLKLGWSLA